MALIKCTDCAADVSDHASACPKCGCPIEIIKTKMHKMKSCQNTLNILQKDNTALHGNLHQQESTGKNKNTRTFILLSILIVVLLSVFIPKVIQYSLRHPNYILDANIKSKPDQTGIIITCKITNKTNKAKKLAVLVTAISEGIKDEYGKEWSLPPKEKILSNKIVLTPKENRDEIFYFHSHDFSRVAVFGDNNEYKKWVDARPNRVNIFIQGNLVASLTEDQNTLLWTYDHSQRSGTDFKQALAALKGLLTGKTDGN